ncbi:nucleotidyltransferase domain-containing protein [Syntrophomonas wolfei]|jgi:hypothetical protein|uniref:nucleotidyltransferase domain-containing protein n=1 Tax=Syntrophomonas wolfei TaxID=863 RepID=UPI0023F41721|nr:nucleotidyltransferase family protein [Syntrophomonas wolfei]
MQNKNLIIETEAFSNEMQLLFLCSIKDLSTEQEEKIRKIIKAGINWELFLQIVKKHRIYMLVYNNLTKIKIVDVDERALKTLQQINQQKVMQSVKLAGELVRLARLLNNNGIRALSLKGPLLAREIYGDIAFRYSKDLDIIIAEQDLEKTDKLLLANGFKNADMEINLSPKQKAHIIKTNHHFVYQKPGGIIIELHWRDNSESTKFQFDKLWFKRRELILSGQSINVLSAEDEFIYLLIHGAIHGYTRLRWLCDIAEIIKKDQLSWNEIINKATGMNIMEVLVQTVILCESLLSVNIPEALKAPLAGNKLGKKMAIKAIPLIIETDEDAFLPGQPLNMHLRKYILLRSKGIKSKLNYLIARFYPGLIDYETIDFSDRFFFMYYITRPFFKIQRMMNKSS